MSPEDGWKEDLCRKHGKKLLLLCREDREVFCLCCEKTQEHRDHHLCLIRDAAKECQVGPARELVLGGKSHLSTPSPWRPDPEPHCLLPRMSLTVSSASGGRFCAFHQLQKGGASSTDSWPSGRGVLLFALLLSGSAGPSPGWLESGWRMGAAERGGLGGDRVAVRGPPHCRVRAYSQKRRVGVAHTHYCKK